MKIFIAHFISFLFHPVLFFLMMPFFIEYRHTDSKLYALKWTIFSSMFVLFGFLLIFRGVLRGVFSDFDVSKKEERYRLYSILLFLALLYLIATIMFKGILFPLTIAVFGIIVGIVVFDIVNHFIKASVHMAVSSAFVLSMGILYGIKAFLLFFLIIPLVAWSRIKIKKHTPLEIVVGSFLGIVVTLFTITIGKYLYS